MRDIVLILLIYGSIPWIFMRPHIGVLVYYWVSYMSPHRMGWGLTYNMPFAQVLSIVTILALIFSKEKKSIPINPLVVFWIIFLVWISITTLFAEFPEPANHQYIKVMKVQLLIFITMMLINTRQRIIQLVWVIFLSIGYYGIKGGIFGILTAGSAKIWGPPGSFIEDNNELALALLVIFPLAFFLRAVSTNKWIQRALLVSTLLIAVSVVASYSRGALVAGLSMVLFLGLKSKRKVSVTIALLVGVLALGAFMPQQWHDRMNTLQTYEEDESALGRIDSWYFAVDIASDRIFGGGFNMWGERSLFAQYDSREGAIPRAAHSIYFGVLGEHGWIGLFLYLMVLFLVWRTCSWNITHSKNNTELIWVDSLSRMIQVSFVAFMVGGTFLNQQYFDLTWHLAAITAVTQAIVKKTLEEKGEMPRLANENQESH